MRAPATARRRRYGGWMRSRRWVGALVLAVFWGLPVLAYAMAPLVLPTHNANGQCEGIGWGCTLTPADGLRFVIFMGSPAWLLGGALALLLTVWIQSRRRAAAPMADPRSGGQDD